LLPLVAGMVLQATLGISIELPPWLLAGCYAAIGWSIGLRFTRPLLEYAVRALPRVLLSIAALIAICSVIGAVLSLAMGVEPLTAFLATSPGGADSIAIIAASSDVDLPFVMAMQTTRFMLVVLLGPTIARLVASRMGWISKVDEA
jgi:membrane AbrB-like protein